MPSATYETFRQAILQRKQVVCDYDGFSRELCPVVLGRTSGRERVLAYQVGGSGSKGLPPGGAWKCLTVSRVTRARLRDGPWQEGETHGREQTCVADVDLDINIPMRDRPG